MKVKDYDHPFMLYLDFDLDIKGKYLDFDEVLKKIPDYEMSEEVIKRMENEAYENFFQRIELMDKEKELKDYAFGITDPYYMSGSREGNVRLFLELIADRPHCMEDWKQEVFKRWAEKFLGRKDGAGETLTSGANENLKSDRNFGAKYALKHYNEIRKLLPEEGTVAAAVRAFNNSLSRKENNNVSKKIKRMLEEDNITPPYRS